MKLLLEENKYINKNFIKWLIKMIRTLIIININKRKLKSIENYINDNNIFNLNNKIDLFKIILQISRNIIYYKYKNTFYIMINPKVFAIGTNIKLIDICKFITYGNNEIQAYHLIINIFYEKHQNILAPILIHIAANTMVIFLFEYILL